MSSTSRQTSKSPIYGTSEPGRKAASDFYPTPPHVTQALLSREAFPGLVWEPACGAGHMSEVLKDFGCTVLSTELREDLGYGAVGVNFFAVSGIVADHVVTNPPFSLAQEFVEHAKKVSTGKVAMLLRLQFLEGQKRYTLFQDRTFPLKTVYVFSKRVNLALGELDEKTGSQVAYAWFVWDKAHTGPATIEWIAPDTSMTAPAKNARKSLNATQVSMKDCDPGLMTLSERTLLPTFLAPGGVGIYKNSILRQVHPAPITGNRHTTTTQPSTSFA